MTTRKEELQLFFKRLRKHENLLNQRYKKWLGKELLIKQGKLKLTKTLKRKHDAKRPPLSYIYNEGKIYYYAVGEYGGRFKRPHYHAIIFNANLESILAAWKLGAVHIGQVSEASIGYTLKYISKGKKAGIQPGDDRLTEFSIMSKGIGANYITEKAKKWHTSDLTERVYCTVDGKKISMPRYYKMKIYHESQQKAIAWHNQIKEREHRKKEMEELEKDPLYLHKKLAAQEAAERANQKKQKLNDKL